MRIIHFPLALILLTLFFNGCNTPLSHKRASTKSIENLPKFVALGISGGDKYVNIPPQGFSISNAVRSMGFGAPVSNPQPSNSPPSSLKDEIRNDLLTNLRDFIAPSSGKDEDIEDAKIRAVDTLTHHFKGSDASDITEEKAKDILQEIKTKVVQKNPSPTGLDIAIRDVFKPYESQVVFNDPSITPDRISSIQSADDIQQFVRVVRQSGDEIVVSAYHVLNSDIGAILLANGDRVSIEKEAVLTPEKMLDGYFNVFDQDSSTVFATPSVIASSEDEKIDSKRIDDVKSFWEKKVMSNNSPYDTVVSVRRALPNGRERVFIVPLPLDDRSTDTVIRKEVMQMHKLAPGDTVHVGTLELLPIVYGSKIISKRLQLTALKEEFELEQMEAHEKHQRLKAFRQKMQSKREGNALVAPQEWVRSASNRIADGFDSVRDAVGLP